MFSKQPHSAQAVRDDDASQKLGEQHNIQHYAEGMKRHLSKKLSIFNFINNDNVTIFLDVGCATGDLLREKYLHDLEHRQDGKERTYIGVDISPVMIEEAQRQSRGTGIIFMESLEEAVQLVSCITAGGRKSVMTLSSVLHEVIHYQPKDTHKAFWSHVWSSVIDYVAIRDFSVNAGLNHQLTCEDSVARVREHFKEVIFPHDHPLFGKKVIDVWEHGYDAIEGHKDPLLANRFLGWGSIEHQDSFTHFLLTFEYLRLNDPENYGRGIRELHENYMSLPFQELCKEIPTSFTPVRIERGITENKRGFILKLFDSNILSDITPTKGVMVFKRRIKPEQYLSAQNRALEFIQPDIRILIEHCSKHLTDVIASHGGSAIEYLRSDDPNKNPDLNRSIRL